MIPVKPATGLIGWYLRRVGYWGITFPWAIYILPGREYPWMIRHERVHESQIKRMGIVRFYAVYFWHQITKGYQNNPLEIEARKAEQ